MPIRPTVLNFSGNDSAGLAGVAMDVRTQMALGVHGASVITANTAQNNQRVISVNPVSVDVFQDQLNAVAELPIKAIKVGLLASVEQAELIQQFVYEKKIPLVLDTVLASSSGQDFSNDDFVDHLVNNLLPSTYLVTPNIDELEQLAGIKILTTNHIISAAEKLLSFGVKAVLIKGGHFQIDESGLAQDYFTDGKRSFWLSNQTIKTHNSRGTGCALASTIASAIALGYSVYDAVVIGKMAISQGLRQAYSVEEESDENGSESKNRASKDKVSKDSANKNYGPVNISHFPNEQIDLPTLTAVPVSKFQEKSFPECNDPSLGLYPVVDRAHWIPTLVSAGVTTLQLRVKDLNEAELENEILAAIELARDHQCRLFINDYWELAIKHKAYGVHLGQEDLDDADIEKIHEAGLRLGISTHCHYEVARAHTYRPSYMACGPVYHTTTKDMPWVPHGVEGLSYWRDVLEYPLVAIGGINQERFPIIAATGVDSIAMITAITEAESPLQSAQGFIDQFQDAANV